jgi:hypothetical protein
MTAMGRGAGARTVGRGRPGRHSDQKAAPDRTWSHAVAVVTAPGHATSLARKARVCGRSHTPSRRDAAGERFGDDACLRRRRPRRALSLKAEAAAGERIGDDAVSELDRVPRRPG